MTLRDRQPNRGIVKPFNHFFYSGIIHSYECALLTFMDNFYYSPYLVNYITWEAFFP